MQQRLKEQNTEQPSSTTEANPLFAALDIGSNSFHMVVARRVGNDFQILESLKQQVQLAAGLDAKFLLDKASIKRAISCLNEFRQYLAGVPEKNVRAVATHTLRVSQNTEQFIAQAAEAFPAPINVISGIEEARLIYKGVAHISDLPQQILVVDIGGGSTEFIIGSDFAERRLRSQPIGCVNLTKTFMADGKLTNSRFLKMVDFAEKGIEKFRSEYLRTGWELCVGSSGSIKTVSRILKAEGYHKRSITIDHLLNIRQRILEFEELADIEIEGLNPSRATILPAAVAILIAAFKLLEIERMEYSRGALREGLLYDMIAQ